MLEIIPQKYTIYFINNQSLWKGRKLSESWTAMKATWVKKSKLSVRKFVFSWFDCFQEHFVTPYKKKKKTKNKQTDGEKKDSSTMLPRGLLSLFTMNKFWSGSGSAGRDMKSSRVRSSLQVLIGVREFLFWLLLKWVCWTVKCIFCFSDWVLLYLLWIKLEYWLFNSRM